MPYLVFTSKHECVMEIPNSTASKIFEARDGVWEERSVIGSGRMPFPVFRIIEDGFTIDRQGVKLFFKFNYYIAEVSKVV